MAERTIQVTERFRSDYKALDPQLCNAVDRVLKDLMCTPFPRALRHHTLSGHRPKIHVVDVTPNHSHQVTFHWDGDVIRLLRVGTHRQIDRRPN